MMSFIYEKHVSSSEEIAGSQNLKNSSLGKIELKLNDAIFQLTRNVFQFNKNFLNFNVTLSYFSQTESKT